MQVYAVQRGGPADGALEAHDQILAIDGQRIRNVDDLVKTVQDVKPGTTIHVKLRRLGKVSTVPIKTVASSQDPKRSVVKITIAPGFNFPFAVNIKLDENIGGPSAGMMFALTIYDTLTPGSLTSGGAVAGTGTITAQGKVGEIGGIQQKIAGARHDGAQLFLVPPSNCPDARTSDHGSMRLAKAATLKQAIAEVTAWGKNHEARLPQCSATDGTTS